MVLSIQYMRAIAALLVVVHHAAWKGEQYSTDPLGWFKVGGAGVDLFFIISGYIMCHTSSLRKITPSAFIRARVARIIPIYWLLTSVALIIYLIAPERINSSGGTTTILHSYTLLPSSAKYLVQNGWTLTYEFFFYGVFALGLLSPVRFERILPCIVLLALVAAGQIAPSTGPTGQVITNPLLLNFVMGIYAFQLLGRKKAGPILAPALIASAIILLTTVNISGGLSVRVIDYALPCLLFFLGMVSLEDLFVQKQHSIFSRTLQAIGDSSYSLYLIHPFVLVPASIILRALGLSSLGYLFTTALIGISVISGWLCYRWLETPVTRLVRKNH